MKTIVSAFERLGSAYNNAGGIVCRLNLISYHFGGKVYFTGLSFDARFPILSEQRMAGYRLADLEQDLDRKLDLILKSVLMPILRLRAAEHGSHFGMFLRAS